MAQSVVPMIAYENGPAAMDWLVKAFGFSELDRRVEDGRPADVHVGGRSLCGEKRRVECGQAGGWHHTLPLVRGTAPS